MAIPNSKILVPKVNNQNLAMFRTINSIPKVNKIELEGKKKEWFKTGKNRPIFCIRNLRIDDKDIKTNNKSKEW